MTEQACQICGNAAGNRHHAVRELMFGLGETFDYVECAACGCLQIAAMPADMARFYPSAYYSLQAVPPRRAGRLERFLKHQRASYELHRRNPLGFLLARTRGHWPYFDWLRLAGVEFASAILDVGCGRGDLLRQLAADGFENLQGCDPFLDKEIVEADGVRIYRRSLGDMPGTFDCLIFRHSFEHMAEPRKVLEQAHARLAPGRFAVIATPVADCRAFQEYGVHWMQLDAPRHLVIQTRRSMRILAEQTGFTLRRTLCDSGVNQFAGSELYRRGIVLHGRQSWQDFAAYFSEQEMAAFARRAEELNAIEEGDQAVFFLQRTA